MCNEESVFEISSNIFPNVLSNHILDEKEITFPEYELSLKSSCGEKQYLEYVDKEDNSQTKKTNLEVCMIDQDILFNKDYSKMDDFSRVEHKLDIKDYIDEMKAISVDHKNDASNTTKFKVLHDQNRVFDRGKK